MTNKFKPGDRVRYLPTERPPKDRGIAAWDAGIRHDAFGTVSERPYWAPYAPVDWDTIHGVPLFNCHEDALELVEPESLPLQDLANRTAGPTWNYREGDLVRTKPGCNAASTDAPGCKTAGDARPGALYRLGRPTSPAGPYPGQWWLAPADGSHRPKVILHPDFFEPAPDSSVAAPPNPEPKQPEPKEPNAMNRPGPIKLETKTFANDIDIATLTAQDLAKNIKAHQEDIEELKKLNETPVAKITAEIEKREVALKAFIAAVNALPAE